MIRLVRIRNSIFAIFRWYRQNYHSKRMIRVDPITILAIIGIATTLWGTGKGLGAMEVAGNLSTDLRNAPAMLNERVSQAHRNGQITGYDREVALQRIDLLTPTFLSYADYIEARGEELGRSALRQGMIEGLASLNPAEKAGQLVGGVFSGKGFDQVIGMVFIANSIEQFQLVSQPFSKEEAALREQIKTIFSLDADRLFLARMQHKINWARSKWQTLNAEYPDNPQRAEELLNWEISNVASRWAENPRLYGTGERWASLNEYILWMVTQAKTQNITSVQGDSSTYQGSMGWWRMGADIAPEKGMCSEISTSSLLDELNLNLTIEPQLRGVSGIFSGHLSGIGLPPGEKNEGTFDGKIISGNAYPMENGFWEYNGQAEVTLSFSVYEVCVQGETGPLLVLDVTAEEIVQASVFGDTKDGACIWWSERLESGDVKRHLYIYSPSLRDRCIQAVNSGTAP